VSKAEAQLRALKAIPEKRWQDKMRKTLTGLVFVCLAVCGAQFWEWSQQWVIGLAIFGGVVMSGEVVLLPFKMLVAIIADGVAKAKGKDA